MFGKNSLNGTLDYSQRGCAEVGGKKMKEILEKLKHMWKDPVNTVEEANARIKEIMPWFYGSIALAVVLSVLGGAVDALSFLSIFGTICVFATMFFGFMLFVVSKGKKKFQALTCNKCKVMAEIKTPEDLAKYVRCSVGAEKSKFLGFSHPEAKNGVISKVEAKGVATAAVSIDLKCPHCGEIKHLIYSMTPFRCSAKEENVRVGELADVKAQLGSSVEKVLSDYDNPEKRASIPYSIHSAKNPFFEQRFESKGVTSSGAHPDYNGVRIDKFIDPEEVIEQFFLLNQLDGNISEAKK